MHLLYRLIPILLLACSNTSSAYLEGNLKRTLLQKAYAENLIREPTGREQGAESGERRAGWRGVGEQVPALYSLFLPSALRPSPCAPRASLPSTIRHPQSVKVAIRWLVSVPIRFHQKLITHQDGELCTFEPSCSHYGLEAVRRHGLRGLLMTSDRLLRCYSGNHKYYPVLGRTAHDPLPEDR